MKDWQEPPSLDEESLQIMIERFSILLSNNIIRNLITSLQLTCEDQEKIIDFVQAKLKGLTKEIVWQNLLIVDKDIANLFNE